MSPKRDFVWLPSHFFIAGDHCWLKIANISESNREWVRCWPVPLGTCWDLEVKTWDPVNVKVQLCAFSRFAGSAPRCCHSTSLAKRSSGLSERHATTFQPHPHCWTGQRPIHTGDTDRVLPPDMARGGLSMCIFVATEAPWQSAATAVT